MTRKYRRKITVDNFYTISNSVFLQLINTIPKRFACTIYWYSSGGAVTVILYRYIRRQNNLIHAFVYIIIQVTRTQMQPHEITTIETESIILYNKNATIGMRAALSWKQKANTYMQHTWQVWPTRWFTVYSAFFYMCFETYTVTQWWQVKTS